MFVGLGVDVVHLPRINALITRRGVLRFAERILSPSEQIDFRSLRASNATDSQVNRFLAVRWSAKESAYKALYGHHTASWKELSYHSGKPAFKPRLEYRPKFGSFIGNLNVSTSHDGEYVFTTVIYNE